MPNDMMLAALRNNRSSGAPTAPPKPPAMNTESKTPRGGIEERLGKLEEKFDKLCEALGMEEQGKGDSSSLETDTQEKY